MEFMNLSNIFSQYFSGTISIEVAPEQLYDTADTILREISTIRTQFENISQCIKNTSSYWEGQVSDRRRKQYEGKSTDIENMISNLNNYVVELKTIASNYVETENKATETANELPTNVLS